MNSKTATLTENIRFALGLAKHLRNDEYVDRAEVYYRLEETLTDALASLSASVGVKPLSWSYDAHTSQWKAHSVLGEWRAWDINGWCITAPNEWPGRIVKGDGRVVANDEYAAIINSALSLPSSGGEVVAE
jgi:hypothetical protein